MSFPPDDGRILDIRNATVYRGDTLVFEDLSFILDEDQHTAIIGPNGVGKSTILKLLAGEVHPMPLRRDRGFLPDLGAIPAEVASRRASNSG